MLSAPNFLVVLCIGTTALDGLIHAFARRTHPVVLNRRTPLWVFASVFALALEALARQGLVALPYVTTIALAVLSFRHVNAVVRGFILTLRTGTDLETAVRERTAELRRAQTGLVQAEKLASVGLVAAGVAHEINNPAAYALTNLTLLREALLALRAQRRALSVAAVGASADVPSTEELSASDRLADDALHDALEGMLRIRDIVADLRSLAQRDTPEPVPVHLAKVVQTSAALAGATVRVRASIELSLERVPVVLGHMGKLSQVVINLIVNAAEAMPENPTRLGRIEVRTRAQGHEVALEVRDDGRGIPAAELGEIFRPLYTTKASGTGLGLAICRRIVEEHGGRIEVESVVGEGTTFRVVLPALLPLDASEAPDEPPRRFDTLPPPALTAAQPTPTGAATAATHVDERKLILIVDDEAFLLKVLSRFVGRRYRVAGAASVDEALRRVREGETPDLVLCDLTMPGKTGDELYRALASERPELATRITFMSGGGTDEQLNRFPGEVGRPTLLKPLEPDGLLAYLDAELAPRASY